MLLSFSPRAIADLEEIGDYIEQDNPAAARRFVADLRKRCSQLLDAPLAGRARPELSADLRSVPFGRYLIFYALKDDNLAVQRVLHGARDLDAFGEEEFHT